jgi:deoxyribonuclease-4
MPLFGAHLSIAGGLHRAVESAVALGMDCVQIFTHGPSQWVVLPTEPSRRRIGEAHQDGLGKGWMAKPLPADQIFRFRSALRRSKLRFAVAHGSYLINLASPDAALYRRSIEAFVVELCRAESLGLHYLIAHPGSPMDAGEEFGLRRIAEAINEVQARCPRYRVRILLETTAGQGASLGHRFEHLAKILERVAEPDRVGVCLDTCHVFAAGYALAPEAEYRATFRAFDRVVGLSRLKVFHINDSQKPLGSRVDRHEHVGRGCLGDEPFRLLVNDWRFRGRPMILETPKEDADGRPMDPVNLDVLRRLVEAPSPRRRDC